MKTFNQVNDEFKRFKSLRPESTLELPDFAQIMDKREGSPSRQSAYNATGFVGLMKRASGAIDKGFEATGLPNVGGKLGREAGHAIDRNYGTNTTEVLETLGRGMPRMMVEGAATLAAPASLPAKLALRGAGYGSAFSRGTAETDSALGGAIDAGTFALGNIALPKLANKVADPLAEFLQRGNRVDLPDPTLPGSSRTAVLESMNNPALNQQQRFTVQGVRVGTEAAGGVPLNELQRQAALSVGPNAVAWDDPMRDPFSAENVAANVAGVGAFTPLMAASVARAPRMNKGNVVNLKDWLEKRDAYIKKDYLNDPASWEGEADPIAYQEEMGIKPNEIDKEPYMDWRDLWEPEVQKKFFDGMNFEEAIKTPREKELYPRIWQVQMDNLRQASKEGDVERANEIRKSIRGLLRRTKKDLRPSIEKIEADVKDMAELARMAGPDDLKGFTAFIADLNTRIDEINEMVVNRDMYAEFIEAQGLRLIDKDGKSTLAYRDGKVLTEAQYKTQPQAVEDAFRKIRQIEQHPDTASSALVEQMGLMKSITPDWLAKEYHATFDTSGKPEFAYNVVMQKVVNRVLDGVQQAKKFHKKPDVNIEIKDPMESVYKMDEAFINALEVFSKHMPEKEFKKIAERSAQIFADTDIDMTTRSGNIVKGDRRASWEMAIIDAAQKFDPEKRTVEVFGKLRPVEWLYAADESGNFAFNPRIVEGRVSEGLRRNPKEIKSIEDLLNDSGVLPGDDFDPDNPGVFGGEIDVRKFMRDLERGAYSLDEDGKQQTLFDPENPFRPIDSPVEGPEGASQVERMRDRFRNEVARNTSEGLYERAKGLFIRRSKLGMPIAETEAGAALTAFRKKHFKLILETLWEDSTGSDSVGPKGRELVRLMKEERGMAKAKSPRQEVKNALASLLGRESKNSKVPEDIKGHNRRYYEVIKKIIPDDTPQALDGYPGKLTVNHPENRKSMIKHRGAGLAVDVARTFRTTFKSWLSDKGYSGTTVDLLTEMATSLALSHEGTAIDFFKLTDQNQARGMATHVKPDDAKGVRGVVGIDFEAINTLSKGKVDRAAYDVLSTLAHELHHMDQKILMGILPKPDAYSREQMRAFKNLEALAQDLNNRERQLILTNLHNSLVPPELSIRGVDVSDAKNLYGASQPTEFSAELVKLVSMSLLAPKKNRLKMMEVFDFQPDAVKEYMRGHFRNIADVLGGVVEATRSVERLNQATESVQGNFKPTKRTKSAASNTVADALDAAVQAAVGTSRLRDADYQVAATKQFIAQMDKHAGKLMAEGTESTWKIGEGDWALHELPGVTAARAEAMHGGAINEAKKSLFGDKTEVGAKPGFYARYFMPFTNLMTRMERAGIPLAADAWEAMQGIFPAVGRLQSGMLKEFVKFDADGRLIPDDEHPLLRKINTDPNGPWRKVFNEVRRWQRNNNHQPLFEKNADGAIVPVDESTWSRLSRNLSDEDKQVVAAGSVATDATYQQASQYLIEGLRRRIEGRVAGTLMSRNRKMTHNSATELANRIVIAANEGALQSIPLGKDYDAIEALLMGPNGLISHWHKTQDHLMSRKGFSSERLPGDYIIKFQTPANQIKYLSAQSQSHAKALVARLQKERNTILGDVVNKRDLKRFNDFDDPFDVLSKFIETENNAWENFLKEYGTTHGEGAAKELGEMFTPGERSKKDLEARTLKRFLFKAKSKVDSSRFDYLDAMLEYTNNLAASLSYTAGRQAIDLILRDPRGAPYQTFKTVVKEHLDYTLSPNPAGLAETKFFLSSYFLGANISSAMIEGTQSAVSLVPNIIRMGTENPAQAWKLLASSVADAWKYWRNPEWKRLAQTKKDPKSHTLEEAQAYVYQEAVKDGLIDHSIVWDPDFERDQRMLWTSRFGHGDYGPMPKGEMVRNKAYAATQWMMRIYSVMTHMNNRLSVIAGAKQGYAQGLRGQDLYAHAQKMRSLANFGGGRANAPGLEVAAGSHHITRSGYGVAITLQGYGIGMVATYAELVRESIGKAKGLTPVQRKQARRAFGTMLMTQVAIGGALSAPFAAASLAFLEEYFGIEANKAVREGIAGLTGDDEELGGVIADFALNGAGNQLLGVDLSSRVGVSNIFGTSSYRGFDAKDVFGPAGSVLGGMIQGLNSFGQNEPVRAGSEIVPIAFRKLFEAADSIEKYGNVEFHDKGGGLLHRPTNMETAQFLLGFRPAAIREKRQAQRMLALSEKNFNESRDQKMDEAARRLVQGDPMQARLTMDEYSRDSLNPESERRKAARMILDRAASSVIETDLLANTHAPDAQEIVGSFGNVGKYRRSEVELLKLKQELSWLLGEPMDPSPGAVDRAMFMDQQMQSTGMSRSESGQLANFLGL